MVSLLQPLPVRLPGVVSLKPVREPDLARVLGVWRYAHPVFDARAVAAQAGLAGLQGRRAAWFAGAWTGYGFHEDGLASGLDAADAILRTSEARDAA